MFNILLQVGKFLESQQLHGLCANRRGCLAGTSKDYLEKIEHRCESL